MNAYFRILAPILGIGIMFLGLIVALNPVMGMQDWLYSVTALFSGAFLIASPWLYRKKGDK